MRIALKVDVDTLRGTLEGTPRLAGILQRNHAQATFLFSLGPDHTGRSIFRMFRPEFLRKVQRTSVVEHYGVKTLLYGTALPGPDIGKRGRGAMLAIASEGFEVGVHSWDHVAWHNKVAAASREWTQREMRRSVERFVEIFGRGPTVYGAAGWQMNPYAFAYQPELGIRVASDTRGTSPFLPRLEGRVPPPVPQLPTTLPTFDELLGRDGWTLDNLHEALLTRSGDGRDHVFTLHAELEGGKLAPAFERLLQGWTAQGHKLVTLGAYAATLEARSLPRAAVIDGRVEGRAGTLAMQGSA